MILEQIKLPSFNYEKLKHTLVISKSRNQYLPDNTEFLRVYIHIRMLTFQNFC